MEEQNDLYEHYRIIADEGQSLLRIDKFLIDRIPNTSRNRIQNAAKSGNILVNEKTVKPNYKVHPGDVVSVVLPYPLPDNELYPEDLPIDIVYEDDELLVINKAAGMVVHPGHGNRTGTLVNGLLHHFKQLPSLSDETRPGLVHRLDKNTTGLMVIAKTEEALTNLSNQFFNRTIERKYVALVWGDLEEEEGTIQGHIGRSPRDRKVMTVFPEGEKGKHAVTHYRVLQRFHYVTLVECKLETGRTHQIRAHFRYIKHPLFNDPDYGGDKIKKGATFSKFEKFVENCFKILPRQALHAASLGFTHPKTGEWKHFEPDWATDIQEVIGKWERYTRGQF